MGIFMVTEFHMLGYFYGFWISHHFPVVIIISWDKKGKRDKSFMKFIPESVPELINDPLYNTSLHLLQNALVS